MRLDSHRYQRGRSKHHHTINDSGDNRWITVPVQVSVLSAGQYSGHFSRFHSVRSRTLEWVDWSSHRRLLKPLGHIPLVEKEEMLYRMNASAEGIRTHATEFH